MPTLALALPVLFAIGVGTLASLGATNTLIQMLSPDDVRGRALSIYTMIAIGFVPLGALFDGALAIGDRSAGDVRSRRRDSASRYFWRSGPSRPIVRTV